MEKDIGFFEKTGEFDSRHTNIVIYRRTALTMRADLAAHMIERWGAVAAESNGEDSAGRHKLRLATPDELVQRACDIADRAVSEFEKRGWIVALPDPRPITRKERDAAESLTPSSHRSTEP